MPISREAVQYVTDRIIGDKIDFILELSGWLEVHRERTDDDPPYMGETPSPGQPGFLMVGGGGRGQIRMQIDRGHWFTQVMDPVGTLTYVVTEIPLPKGSGSVWAFQPVLNHLREAERNYAAGDDAGVFFRCRAALEALPGAPKDIFAGLADPNLAECINALTKESVDYLHRGRHTQREGEQRGEFPVDHADAVRPRPDTAARCAGLPSPQRRNALKRLRAFPARDEDEAQRPSATADAITVRASP